MSNKPFLCKLWILAIICISILQICSGAPSAQKERDCNDDSREGQEEKRPCNPGYEDPEDDDDDGLSGVAIAGVLIGVSLFILGACILTCYCCLCCCFAACGKKETQPGHVISSINRRSVHVVPSSGVPQPTHESTSQSSTQNKGLEGTTNYQQALNQDKNDQSPPPPYEEVVRVPFEEVPTAPQADDVKYAF